ncbi:MAG: hypothetical protein M1827_005473 [Pycnora praestabilis]|nr:MAG: hypothetical protein M1827_005473 [Pycnora praestabilis]
MSMTASLAESNRAWQIDLGSAGRQAMKSANQDLKERGRMGVFLVNVGQDVFVRPCLLCNGEGDELIETEIAPGWDVAFVGKNVETDQHHSIQVVGGVESVRRIQPLVKEHEICWIYVRQFDGVNQCFSPVITECRFEIICSVKKRPMKFQFGYKI